MTVVAALLVAVAFAVARPPGLRRLRARRVVAAAPWRRPVIAVRRAALVGVGVGCVALALLPRPSWVLCGLAAGVGLLTAGTVAVRGRAASRARVASARVVEGTSLLAAELRAGAVPSAALESVAVELVELAPIARAAAAGTDVVGELRRAAGDPGQGLLGDVAAAWDVAERGGAPLTAVLERLAEAGRDQLELDDEVAAELAPARATARVLAVLPAFGLALGASAGGDPVGVIVDTTLGAGCVLLGVVLASVGVLWIELSTARAAR